MVTAELVHRERDRLVLARVLALDHQHRDAVDEEDHVLPRPVAPVVDVELLRHLIHVPPLLARAGEVAVINQHQVQFPALLGAEEFSLVAQVGEEVAVAGDVRVEPLELAHQRALGFFVFRVEGAHLGVEQVAEVKRRRPRPVLGRGAVRIKPPPRLGFARGTYVQPISCA